MVQAVSRLCQSSAGLLEQVTPLAVSELQAGMGRLTGYFCGVVNNMWGIPAEIWQAMQNGENPYGQAQAEQAAKENAEKAKAAEAEAKKTPDEKKRDGLAAAKHAGKALANRIMGIVDRETGKITDQFTVLEDFKEETDLAIKEAFVAELDIILRDRGLVEDEEDDS